MESYTDTLRQISRELSRELGLLKIFPEKVPLNLTERHVLLEVECNTGLTIKTLAGVVQVSVEQAEIVVKSLAERNLVELIPHPSNKSERIITLLKSGQQIARFINTEANVRIEKALSRIEYAKIQEIIKALLQYTNLLKTSRIRDLYNIRAINRVDNIELAAVLSKAISELNENNFGILFEDTQLEQLYHIYQQSGSFYLVVEKEDNIFGGIGIAPVVGLDKVCQIQRFLLTKQVRGVGLSYTMLDAAISRAQDLGYKKCYAELRSEVMPEAQNLYIKYGFTPIDKPMVNRGLFHADRWYIKDIIKRENIESNSFLHSLFMSDLHK